MGDLITVQEASKLIGTGQPLLVAGDETRLAQLPKGQWIGGTSPYFMTKRGGVIDREMVFVTPLREPITTTAIHVYPLEELQRIPENYPDNGCSFIIIPGGSEANLRFAQECATWRGWFNSPLVGWNAGVLLSDSASVSPRVFDGTTLQSFENAAVVLHATTNAKHVAHIEIINAFRQGNGDKITFPRSGFTITDCFVNGEPRDFVEYVQQGGIDTRLPLVADYAGAQINVSFKSIDASQRRANLFAPVFEGVEYRFAAPVADLADVFGREFAKRHVLPAFSCNCILNFLYAELEGKCTGEATGPITFGEIAYVQLNQTLVYVCFEPVA